MLVGQGQTGCSRTPYWHKGLKWNHLPGGEPGHIRDYAILLLGLWLTKAVWTYTKI